MHIVNIKILTCYHSINNLDSSHEKFKYDATIACFQKEKTYCTQKILTVVTCK